jgi:hypothetical protein
MPRVLADPTVSQVRENIEMETLETLDGLTCDELVEAYAELQDKIRDLRDLAADVEQRIVELAEHDKWVVDRVGFVEVKPGARRTTWDTDLLWAATVEHGRRHLDLDPATGEVQTEGESVGAACRKVLGKTPNFTRGGVAAIGLDADRFCETSAPGRSTVKIERLP